MVSTISPSGTFSTSLAEGSVFITKHKEAIAAAVAFSGASAGIVLTLSSLRIEHERLRVRISEGETMHAKALAEQKVEREKLLVKIAEGDKATNITLAAQDKEHTAALAAQEKEHTAALAAQDKEHTAALTTRTLQLCGAIAVGIATVVAVALKAR